MQAAIEEMKRTPRIGLALGGGAARGWAHIGVLRALEELDVRPDIVAGTSIGALAGGAWVAGELDALEQWVRGLDRLDILRLVDARLSHGGFMRGGRLMRAIGEHVADRDIQDLPVTFAAVATEFQTGREVWLSEGSLLEAIRASIALPGLFSPARTREGWLLDGGLVNPVPVSLCRALGAQVVVAVNLNGDTLGRNAGTVADKVENEDPGLYERIASRLHSSIRLRLDSLISSTGKDAERRAPGLFDVLAGSINIVQDRLTRSRMAGDPPEVHVRPTLSQIRLMEFDRAAEAIDAGRRAMHRSADDLERALELHR